MTNVTEDNGQKKQNTRNWIIRRRSIFSRIMIIDPVEKNKAYGRIIYEKIAEILRSMRISRRTN